MKKQLKKKPIRMKESKKNIQIVKKCHIGNKLILKKILE